MKWSGLRPSGGPAAAAVAVRLPSRPPVVVAIEYRDQAGRRWIETADELHLSLGKTARVELGSADVIHSFWAPNVAGKMDVIPGRANVIDLTPGRPGWSRGQCAEFWLSNDPGNLVHCMREPQSVEPGGGMPNLSVSEKDARDIAANLYAGER